MDKTNGKRDRKVASHPYHDPKFDSQIRVTCAAKYPSVQLLRFYRSRHDSLHVITFAALPANLIEAKLIRPDMVPRRKDSFAHGGHQDNEGIKWMARFDGRRKGALSVSFWLLPHAPIACDEPLARLHPTRWPSNRSSVASSRRRDYLQLVWTNPNMLSPTFTREAEVSHD
jgi:hypothetical protein